MSRLTRDSLEDFPLAEYAAKHWADHAWLEDVSGTVEDGMKQLFDPTRHPSKPHLAIWETPLHLTLLWGQVDIARMIIERSMDLTAQNNYGPTPLLLASQRGELEVDVAPMLIEHGTDVTARKGDGETPLHLASQRGQVYFVLQRGHIDIACMLIERSADLTTPEP